MYRPAMRRTALLAAVTTLAAGLIRPAAAEASDPPPEVLPPTAFPDAVRAGDAEAIIATFADDIVFDSPILAEPFVGRAVVGRLFVVLVETFDDVTIREEIHAPGQVVLWFAATVDGTPIEIIDLLTLDDTGHVTHFVATTRLLDGTNALTAAIAPHLAEIIGA